MAAGCCTILTGRNKHSCRQRPRIFARRDVRQLPANLRLAGRRHICCGNFYCAICRNSLFDAAPPTKGNIRGIARVFAIHRLVPVNETNAHREHISIRVRKFSVFITVPSGLSARALLSSVACPGFVAFVPPASPSLVLYEPAGGLKGVVQDPNNGVDSCNRT